MQQDNTIINSQELLTQAKHYQIFDNYDSDNGPSFSWYSCDICNSGLGGNRFGLLQIEHNPGKTS